MAIHWFSKSYRTEGMRRLLLPYRFGGVVVIMGFAILFFQELDPVGRDASNRLSQKPKF